jgi:magnesium transporter
VTETSEGIRENPLREVSNGQVLEAESTVAGGDHHTAAAAKQAILDSADGTIAFEESASTEVGDDTRPAAVAVWLFRERRAAEAVDISAIPDLIKQDKNFVWIDLSEYAEDTFRHVAELSGVHRRVAHVVLAPWQRPRVDVFGDHFLATVTVADLEIEQRRITVHELDLIVGNNLLISAHKQALPFAGRLLARARQDPDLVRLDSAFMLYIVLDQLLEYYEAVQERLKGAIEQMQERALSDNSDEFLQDLLKFKRDTFALSQFVDHHHNVFQAFLRPDFPYVSGENVDDYFHLLQARLSRLTDNFEGARQEVNSAFDIYVSHQSHRTSSQMKLLTMVATILLPANVILGFFGTQFRQMPIYTPLWFWLMMVSIIGTTAVALVFFRRGGWV